MVFSASRQNREAAMSSVTEEIKNFKSSPQLRSVDPDDLLIAILFLINKGLSDNTLSVVTNTLNLFDEALTREPIVKMTTLSRPTT